MTERSEQTMRYSEDSVSMYMHEAGHDELLTKEEEADLAKRIRAGRAAGRILVRNELNDTSRNRLQQIEQDGENARERMVRMNLRLVVDRVKNYYTQHPLQDRIQLGNKGLMRAVDKFDYRKGYKFSTYAVWWIRQSLQRGIANESRQIRLPAQVEELLSRLKRLEERALHEQRTLSEEEKAEELGVSIDRLKQITQAPRYLLSMDAPLSSSEDDSTTFGDFVADKETRHIQNEVVTGMAQEEFIEEVLAVLTERERTIITQRFGLHDGESKTLQEIGENVSLSRERIRQIEDKAMKKIRQKTKEMEAALREGKIAV